MRRWQDDALSAQGAAAPTWTGLFPASVVTVTQAELAEAPALMPEEEPFVARAVPARALEFTQGRSCARAALARLGCPPVAIAVGAEREPIWPPGFLGSITHCRGHCAAAVTRAASSIAGVGLDVEPAQPLAAELVAMVCRAGEREWIAQRGHEGLPWERLVFSAKESVFKCLFPIVRRYVDFHEVELVLADDGSLRVRAAGLLLAERVAIRCDVRAGFVLTVATLHELG
jgi:4'-phosphopantetheinyl transferase EntD